MEREPSAGSSNIGSVGFEPKGAILEGAKDEDIMGVMEVEFKGGSIYHYNVSKKVFEDWKSGGFGGSYFHQHIRRFHQGERQPREQKDSLNG